jgi:2-desacetyl-2-hydroxyethyl bacteriochlorophyllide A dehydrogenase
MQAVLFPSPRQISIESMPDPVCAADEAIIQVSQVGICGTDLHIYHDEYHSTFPLIAGHEFVGRVVDVGRDASWLARGERVAVDPNLYCGECYFCRQEQSNHCLNWQGVGITRPGGFAEYVAVPARACYQVPLEITDTQAAFVEPLSCVIHALKRLRVWPGDEVLIFGAGPMGLLLVQALRRSGASCVVVVETQEDRRQLALNMGAAAALPPATDNSSELLAQAPHGYAIVIDATGVPSVIGRALQFLKPRGQYLQFGVAPMGASVQWQPYEIFHKDLTILGSYALCYTFQPAIAWLKNRVVDIAPLVSHVLPLAGFEQGFHDFAQGKTLKVHLRPVPA